MRQGRPTAGKLSGELAREPASQAPPSEKLQTKPALSIVPPGGAPSMNEREENVGDTDDETPAVKMPSPRQEGCQATCCGEVGGHEEVRKSG